MPSFYAHYRFGSSVLNMLSEPLRSVCTDNRALFDIGLHGPDIFFFYCPFKANHIFNIGSESHGMTGKSFFERFAAAYDKHGQQTALLAYFCGFLCHLALDSVCHPEVYRAEKYTGQTHAAIETSLERVLLLKDGIDPVRHDPCGHFQVSRANTSAVTALFPTISEKDVEKSLRGTVFYSRLLFIKNKALRSILHTALQMLRHSESIHDMVMMPHQNPHCIESDKKLSACFDSAKTIALELLSETHIYIESKTPVGSVFDRTFSGPKNKI